ncbi:MAG: F-box protein 11, partial [Candidatus Hydrogenedentes bacterium]|nr:F-box protein 11 [Candidatus Hydrogenedentota bacterium]
EEVGAGDEAWNAAELAGENYPEAATRYAAAETAYTAALAASPERKKTVGVTVALTPDADYQSINAAIQAVSPDTRIVIKPGLYEEAIVIDKKVELAGEGPRETIRIEPDDDWCVTMKTDEAVVRGLKLYCRVTGDNKKGGIYVEKGKLIVDDCDIHSDSLSCVEASGAESRVEITQSRLHDSKEGRGAYFHDGATGKLDNCQVQANAYPGVDVIGGAVVELVNCRMSDGLAHGVFVSKDGKCTLDTCEMAANTSAGIAVVEGGHADVRNCKIHDGKQSGLFANSKGTCLMDTCEIYTNERAGIEIREQGNPTVRNTIVTRNVYRGVIAHPGALGLIENCDLRGNPRGAYEIKQGSQLRVNNNQE